MSPPWYREGEQWTCNPRVSGSIPAPATWKSCLSGWKFMDSHKTHKAFIQVAKRLEGMSGHNECCSAPSLCWVPACVLCERHTIVKYKNKHYGGKYLVFVSSRSVKLRGFSFLSLYKSLFIFQFLNVKMYNYGKQNIIVNFIIKKLKKTQFPQKV